MVLSSFFFFQAEDGIRDLVRSRGLGDVYKRQVILRTHAHQPLADAAAARRMDRVSTVTTPLVLVSPSPVHALSLIHI